MFFSMINQPFGVSPFMKSLIWVIWPSVPWIHLPWRVRSTTSIFAAPPGALVSPCLPNCSRNAPWALVLTQGWFLIGLEPWINYQQFYRLRRVWSEILGYLLISNSFTHTCIYIYIYTICGVDSMIITFNHVDSGYHWLYKRYQLSQYDSILV